MDKEHKSINGHRNSNAINTYMYIQNTPTLYFKAKALKKSESSLDKASAKMLAFLHERKVTKTPEGVVYNKTNIKLAMRRI